MSSKAGTSIAPARNLRCSGAWRLSAIDKGIREGSLLYRVLEAHLENSEAAYALRLAGPQTLQRAIPRSSARLSGWRRGLHSDFRREPALEPPCPCSTAEWNGEPSWRVLAIEPLSHWDLPVLTEIFRREVLRMLQSKGLLTEERLQLLYSWCHSGFYAHIGAPLDPRRNPSAIRGPGALSGARSSPPRPAPGRSRANRAPRAVGRLGPRSARRLDGAPALAALRPGHRCSRRAPERTRGCWRGSVCTYPSPTNPFAFAMAPSLTMRVTAELRCQFPNTSTTPSSRSSRAGSPAKPGAGARAYLINKIYGENPLVCPQCGGEISPAADPDPLTVPFASSLGSVV
jgi:hypothetical protein